MGRMGKVDYLRAEVASQRKWIEDRGGCLSGYIERYGADDDPEKYGAGGRAIWNADYMHLCKLEERLKDAESRAGRRRGMPPPPPIINGESRKKDRASMGPGVSTRSIQLFRDWFPELSGKLFENFRVRSIVIEVDDPKQENLARVFRYFRSDVPGEGEPKGIYINCPACSSEIYDVLLYDMGTSVKLSGMKSGIHKCALCEALFGRLDRKEDRVLARKFVKYALPLTDEPESHPKKYFDFLIDKKVRVHGWYSVYSGRVVQIG